MDNISPVGGLVVWLLLTSCRLLTRFDLFYFFRVYNYEDTLLHITGFISFKCCVESIETLKQGPGITGQSRAKF